MSVKMITRLASPQVALAALASSSFPDVLVVLPSTLMLSCNV